MSFSTFSFEKIMSSVKYLYGVLTGAAIVVVAAFGLFMLSLGKPIESGRWVNECLTIKRSAIEQFVPKIVILSGSNSLFGFSAQRLTEVHGIPTVNAAVHAGLGIDYILYFGRQQIAPGRIFVLPLEYSLYGKKRLANAAALYQVAGYDPQYFWELSLADKINMFGEITPLDRVRLTKNLLLPFPKLDAIGYQSRTLSRYGDETANSPLARTKSMVNKVKAEAPATFSHDDAAWQVIAKFAADAKTAGAEVVLAYPNIYSGALDLKRNEPFFRAIVERAEAIGLRVIGTPKDSAFNDDDMFDTSYHQNNQGQLRSTERLLGQLRLAGVL